VATPNSDLPPPSFAARVSRGDFRRWMIPLLVGGAVLEAVALSSGLGWLNIIGLALIVLGVNCFGRTKRG
jgi:hypothetical protein